MKLALSIFCALLALWPFCSADTSSAVSTPANAKADTPTVLSAQFAATGLELPFCEGAQDALPVTFSHPLADDPSPENFAVTVGDETVEPVCATLDPASEDNEKQTVLLLGPFLTADGLEPTQVEIQGVAFTVNGTRVELEKDEDEGFSVDLGAPTATIAVTSNQTLADFTVLNLSAEGNTAEDDENGCAATFPASTYAIRLIFSSGVRDLDADGALVPLGADPSAARTNELFSLRGADGGPSMDMIIGQADADGDNYADVCVQGAGAARDAAVLVVTCDDGAAVTAPDGTPCTTPIEVDLSGTISMVTVPPATAPAPVEAEAAPPPVQTPADASGAAPLLRSCLPWTAPGAAVALTMPLLARLLA